MQDVGIVIPVFGRFDLLQKCTEVLPQGVPVYVVDDATPTLAERRMIKEYVRDKHFRYFTNERNLGFPRTVNKGVEKVKEPLVLILNSDVILQSDAIGILADEFLDKEVGTVGPMLIFPQGTEYGPAGHIQHVGIVFDILGMPKHLFIGWLPDNPRAVKRRDTLQAVTGACMMTRRDLFVVKMRGFCEEYGRGTYEDIEYCVVTRTMFKQKVVCNPAAIGAHYVGQSAKSVGGYTLNANHQKFVSRVGNIVRNDDYLYL